MQSNPPTFSSFRQSYVERDRMEMDRFEDDRRRKLGMAIALVPLGIAMALIVNYTNIVVAIDDADWQFVLHRPNFVNILKLSVAPFIGGGVGMLLAVMLATSIAGREGRFWPFALTAFFYSVFMPLLVGLLLPANLFLLDVTGLSVFELSFGEALSAWIWGTPFFVFTYTLTGIKQGVWAGIGAVLLGAAIFRYVGPNQVVFSAWRTTVVTMAVAALAAGVMLFGPLGIFELLFNQFRAA
ncbi:MAG: hypothetical protein QF357_09710 [Dehalococcoidia bacterium]|jgi:hypothetical protein|nr:hypothetical protein [Dehalococcoidia bacterium]